VHVAQARKIRAIANSQEKNDANDAFWLAHYTSEGRLPEAYVPPPLYRELRIATRERIQAVRRRTKLYQRLRAHLAQLGRRVPARTLRASGPAASCSRSRRRSAASAGTRSGRILASTVVAETGPIRRFRTAKALGRFSGLIPADRSSGGRMRHGGISREGSAYLRWALTQMAMACLRARRGPGLVVGDWIRRKQRRVGIKAKARCAAARKLAESIWRLFHYGECFDPSRPFGCRTVGIA
jgi:transposase